MRMTLRRKSNTPSVIGQMLNNEIESQFIISTNNGRTNAATRKIIRSHVMRGKNKRKFPSTMPQQHQHKVFGGVDNGHFESVTEPEDLPKLVAYTGLPRRIGNETSFIRFADDTVEPDLLLDCLKCKHHNNRHQPSFLGLSY